MASTPHICTILPILSAPKCHETKHMQKKKYPKMKVFRYIQQNDDSF